MWLEVTVVVQREDSGENFFGNPNLILFTGCRLVQQLWSKCASHVCRVIGLSKHVRHRGFSFLSFFFLPHLFNVISPKLCGDIHAEPETEIMSLSDGSPKFD